MDYRPLVNEQIEAGAQLVRRFDQHTPVAVAFWLKEADNEFWYLHLASDAAYADTHSAYLELWRLVRQINSPALELAQVRVIAATNPMAREAMDIGERYPETTRLGGHTFGDIFADDIYLYPLLHSTTT